MPPTSAMRSSKALASPTKHVNDCFDIALPMFQPRALRFAGNQFHGDEHLTVLLTNIVHRDHGGIGNAG